MARQTVRPGRDPETEAYCRALMERAAQVRLPELFADRSDALYRQPERGGVTTVALRRAALTDAQLVELLRYRLGQYVHPVVDIIDPRLVYERRLEHEPLANESEGDVHFLSGVRETGEILCYAVLRSLPDAQPHLTLRERDRPYLPAEKVHGWGVFNRLQRLPELPLNQVFELGRYVKNHSRNSHAEPSARAPSEVALAAFRTLSGPLRAEVGAFVGDLEEGVAKHTLDFFHIPTVLIRGVVPYSPEGSYFFPRNQNHTVYPFAALVTDIIAERLDAIDAALSRPGREGLRALFALKETSRALPSRLEPPGGLADLITAELPEQGGTMAHRREMLEMAEHLRAFDPFTGLSDAEMRLLCGFMERRAFSLGGVIVHQGAPGDALFLIEKGEAEVRVWSDSGVPTRVAQLGPGHYFGEIALLQGGVRTADVVAATPMQVLRLSRTAYQRFLGRLGDVQERIARTAAQRAAQTAERVQGRVG